MHREVFAEAITSDKVGARAAISMACTSVQQTTEVAILSAIAGIDVHGFERGPEREGGWGVTESALVTQPGIAMALRQAESAGRHRRKSHGAGWTMPRQDKKSYAATGRTTPRHRKTLQPAAGRTTPRHRKTPQSAAGRTTPRHRKQGPGNIQAIYPSFRIGQDNPIRIATKRAALPGALAVGLLAIGGAITGGFSTPLPDTDRAGGSGAGGMTSAQMPPPPALTAMSTPARADRGLRGPVDASAPDALPISKQTETGGVIGNGSAREPAETRTTTTVRDRAPAPGAFAPSVPPDSSGGHGGGGPAESSAPPAAGGRAPSAVFGPGGPLNWLAGAPGEEGGNGATGVAGANGNEVRGSGNQGTDDEPGPQGRDGNATPGEEGPDHSGRVDHPRGSRGTGGPGDAGGAGRGLGSSGKTGDAGSPGNGGSDSQPGSGRQDRRGTGRR